MITFLVGMAILILGGIGYGAYCNKVFGPDNRPTPAISMQDGVDFVPMPMWKNSLIQLLNIAGTGPILGPIQGVLFGPIAFIAIPIGCVFGGALHDFFCGMISIREKGEQMPGLVKRFLGSKVYAFYNIFLCLLLLLVVAVFVTTPGDLIVGQVVGQKTIISNPLVWVVYACIFAYYLVAALFPIDKIIGRIYPIFGMILLISAVGVGAGIFFKGYPLMELSSTNWTGVNWMGVAGQEGLHLIPIFFVTVACGIVSGFHSTQSTMIARSVASEKEGRMTFYNMMLLEGFIAMIWAAAAMGAYALIDKIGFDSALIGQAGMIGIIARDMLGNVGGLIAIIGVIILPISTGDTALRSLRLILGDYLHIDQTKRRNRFSLTFAISAVVLVILLFSKLNANGFNILWRYFAWSNQTIAIFAFALITVYLMREKKNYVMSLIPGCFYCFIITSFIFNAAIGFNLSYTISYILGIVCTVLYAWFILHTGKQAAARLSEHQ